MKIGFTQKFKENFVMISNLTLENLKIPVLESIKEYTVTAYNPRSGTAMEQTFMDYNKALQVKKEYEVLGLISFLDVEKDSVLF